MSLQVCSITYAHPGEDVLFHDMSLSVSDGEKIAVAGNNGAGKSTLLKIISGELLPSCGQVMYEGKVYVVPQHFGQFNDMTVAHALGVGKKLEALHNILAGSVSEDDFTALGDDWDIENRAVRALDQWGIGHLPLDSPMNRLSGGEKTRAFLAGIEMNSPSIVLMDEPTNHLDSVSRELLYNFVESSRSAVIVVSHDRELLNRMSSIYELSDGRLAYYPMSYDEYEAVRDAGRQALVSQLEDCRKELAKARKTAQDAMQRQLKHNSRGEKHSQKKGLARIVMGNMKDQAENSTARLDKVQQEKMQEMNAKIRGLNDSITDILAMKVDFHTPVQHLGKRQIETCGLNYAYGDSGLMWGGGLDIIVRCGERIHLTGDNGSGKSTFLRLLVGEQEPVQGSVWRSGGLEYVYLDQEYSFLDGSLSVFGQVQRYGVNVPEHELKICLCRFLFTEPFWDRKCSSLSGGEKMRLALCCLMIRKSTPDIIIADEPTNNIDITNMKILSASLKDYGGTLIVVSHDTAFAREIGLSRTIAL